METLHQNRRSDVQTIYESTNFQIETFCRTKSFLTVSNLAPIKFNSEKFKLNQFLSETWILKIPMIRGP